MTFAQATKKELRNAFGPTWVASFTSYAVAAVVLVVLGGAILTGTNDLAASVAADLVGVAK